jgi:hypothetical protein
MLSLRSKLCVFVSLLALAPASAFSDTIISVVLTAPPASADVDGRGIDPVSFAAASWTTTSAYSNVSIAAEVECVVCGIPSTITAYLTTAIGPSETVADQIATYTDTVSTGVGVPPELDTLFSGLTLGAGTYYLVLANGTADTEVPNPDPSGNVDFWYGNIGPGEAISTATGVAYNGDKVTDWPFGCCNSSNPPANTFSNFGDLGLNFQVTGDPGSGSPPPPVPEPSSISLLLIGMAGGLYLLRRQLTA